MTKNRFDRLDEDLFTKVPAPEKPARSLLDSFAEMGAVTSMTHAEVRAAVERCAQAAVNARPGSDPIVLDSIHEPPAALRHLPDVRPEARLLDNYGAAFRRAMEEVWGPTSLLQGGDFFGRAQSGATIEDLFQLSLAQVREAGVTLDPSLREQLAQAAQDPDFSVVTEQAVERDPAIRESLRALAQRFTPTGWSVATEQADVPEELVNASAMSPDPQAWLFHVGVDPPEYPGQPEQHWVCFTPLAYWRHFQVQIDQEMTHLPIAPDLPSYLDEADDATFVVADTSLVPGQVANSLRDRIRHDLMRRGFREDPSFSRAMDP